MRGRSHVLVSKVTRVWFVFIRGCGFFHILWGEFVAWWVVRWGVVVVADEVGRRRGAPVVWVFTMSVGAN